MELPYYSKFILIAAYLASYNPARTDKRFFLKVIVTSVFLKILEVQLFLQVQRYKLQNCCIYTEHEKQFSGHYSKNNVQF
jgi:hypothetical protein